MASIYLNSSGGLCPYYPSKNNTILVVLICNSLYNLMQSNKFTSVMPLLMEQQKLCQSMVHWLTASLHCLASLHSKRNVYLNKTIL